MGKDAISPVFDWSNFEEIATSLFAAPAEPEWLVVSERGQSANYALPGNVGDGRMEYLELASGMRILVYDCSWKKEQICHVLDGEWIRFNFSLAANSTMQAIDSDQVFSVFPSWRIINNLKAIETVETFFAEQKLVWVTIVCKPEHLADLSGVALENMPEVLQTMLSRSGSSGFHDLFDFTARLNAIAADIIRCSLPGGLRISYIEARAVELLCYGLDHVMHPRDDVSTVALTAAEKDALIGVRETLCKNYSMPPTVVELAKSAGINRNKLYYGFKIMFGSTISDFVQNLRLDEGHRLLLETQMPLIDIAEQVGFHHQCNFSTAIKKRFGLSPTQIRKDQKQSA